MHEPVHSIFHSKLLSALRLPSFAGEGLPERMRSISFALLGLTAAAGLALVAIFAQPSFSLLSPAPLPDQPSAGESVAEARKLPLVHRPMAVLAAQPARAQSTGDSPAADSPSSGPSRPSAGAGEDVPPPDAVDVPAPVGAPEPSSGNSGGGSETGGGSGSTPASPDQTGASPSAPVSSPSTQPSAPAPEASTSAPKPEPAPAPGNSASTAAAEHASERGIEASASSGSAAGGGAATASVAPEAPTPGNGNGLAKGHDK